MIRVESAPASAAERVLVSPQGRPSKVRDGDLVGRIVQAIAAGAGPEEAAVAAGLSRAAYFAWMQRGRRADGLRAAGIDIAVAEAPFLDFLDCVREAEARSEVILVARVASVAARGSWRAAAWLLERRFPSRWARNRPVAQDADLAYRTVGPVTAGSVSVEDLEVKVRAILHRSASTCQT